MIIVPKALSLRSSLAWANELSRTPHSDCYNFDFSLVQHCPPFGMLFTAAVIRRFKATRISAYGSCACLANGCTNPYASFMGFWRASGIPVGNTPGAAPGNGKYLPISTIDAAEIKARAAARARKLSQEFDELSSDLAEVIAQDTGPIIETTLTYCFRELIRNVAEHSGQDTIWYAAQFWPTKDLVELAILDEGRGIFSSLQENPDLDLENEVQAIVNAVRPGISRVNLEANPPKAMWPGYGASESENSGYGLYVLRLLAEHAGSLVIISNSNCVYFKANRIQTFETAYNGTAVRLLLSPSRLGDLLYRVLQRVGKQTAPSKLTPSLLASLSTERSNEHT